MAFSFLSQSDSQFFDVAELRSWLKLPFADDDDVIEKIADSARHMIENYLGEVLRGQVWSLTLDDWPADRFIALALRPFNGVVDGVVQQDRGTVAVLVDDLRYDAVREGLLIQASAPKPKFMPGAVKLTLSFGVQRMQDLKPALRHALYALVAHLYFNRGDDRAQLGLLPATIRTELDLLRRRRLI